uniref:Centromere protein X n=1 Tax=Caenorhabditis tropicalis TaxID=1561998 RepID=A0A1I7ULJ1_9PELO
MPLLPRFLRRFFQRGTSPSPHSERVGPLTEAVKQVSVFKEAVRTNDKQMLLELFSISEGSFSVNCFE